MESPIDQEGVPTHISSEIMRCRDNICMTCEYFKPKEPKNQCQILIDLQELYAIHGVNGMLTTCVAWQEKKKEVESFSASV